MVRQISFEEDLIVIFRVDYRLEYHNLKQERSQNSLSLEEIQVLSRKATLGEKVLLGPLASIPGVQQHGGQRGHETLRRHRANNHKVEQGSLLFEVFLKTHLREGGYSVSGEDVIEEINIFEGNENRLTFEEVTKV